MRSPEQSFFDEVLSSYQELEVVMLSPGDISCLLLRESCTDSYYELCTKLASTYGYEYLSCLTAVDRLHDKRFEVVLHIENWECNTRLWLKVYLDRLNPLIASVSGIWSSAQYLEREVYDMFGIEFAHHPRLTRILSPEEETTHPLRKDFILKHNDLYGKEELEKVGQELDVIPSGNAF